MSPSLTLSLHCGHPAPVEWAADGSLWLVEPRKRLGSSVAAAAIKQRRLKCAECRRKKGKPARGPQGAPSGRKP